MIYQLENNFLKVSFASLGAELKSIFSKQANKELLYDGKSEFWNRSAPILFPIVGRLKNNQYHYRDSSYTLSQHGFARDKEFIVFEKTAESISFELSSNEDFKKQYPFDFGLSVSYTLKENQLLVSYQVVNEGSTAMFFSIGAHPGFNCPLFEDEQFSDYTLAFEHEEILQRHLLDQSTGLFDLRTEKIALEDGKLNLDYHYFAKDAIVLKQLKSQKIELINKNNSYQLEFVFPNFSYLGIWSKPNAPFICLEPWHGLADNINSTGILDEKEGIIRLESDKSFKCAYSMKFSFS